MTILDRVKAALAAHPDNQDLKLLAAGWNEARNRYAADKSAANLKGWQQAESALSGMLDGLPDPQPSTPSPADLPDPLLNPHQVWLYLRSLGYKCSASQPSRAIKENKLSPRKGGGFSQSEVRRYAVTHKLKRLPSAESPADDKPALKVDGQETGAADRKALSAARLMDANAELKEIEVRKARAEYVDILVVDREQAELCQAIRMHLSPMVRSTAERVLDLVGGDRATAAQIIELVGGSQEKVEDLLTWMAARKPDIVAMYKPYMRRALDVFARGEWMTKEMRDAWARYQVNREDAELSALRALIRESGGDTDTAQSLLERYYVRALDA